MTYVLFPLISVVLKGEGVKSNKWSKYTTSDIQKTRCLPVDQFFSVSCSFFYLYYFPGVGAAISESITSSYRVDGVARVPPEMTLGR
ncbi:hypothetical protein CEXT_250701 [Caerostris extrusa]|uniref:Uncharacterized protein n=1 Tax=Caerostris extrusa TaxID=172846 RepID=A0AAV4P050_CAEEX|nr:hypothetical protein CEXT_250701 [Caerostris extrusa]